MAKPKRITLHCAASTNGVCLPASVIRRQHIEERGWSDIGYHMVIQPDGEVERGRGLNEKGAHVSGENEGNIGICLVGNDRFGRNQFDALRYQLDGITQIYDIPHWEIRCHHQFQSAIRQGKTCPNLDINRIMAWYIGHREDAIKIYLL